MASVASGGAADRMAVRIFRKVLRAGSGMAARYSSTVFGGFLPFAEELRFDFAFFMRAMLQETPVQVDASAGAFASETLLHRPGHTSLCPWILAKTRSS